MDKDTVNFGKFSTPLRYVALGSEWLLSRIDSSYVILDTSCGDGVFFALTWDFPQNRCVGFDIDDRVVTSNRLRFPFVEFRCRNSLSDVSRQSFLLHPESNLVIVGNPPYNDSTSAIKRQVKEEQPDIDPDIKRRDVGLSFLNSYHKLEADYVLVLHPLAYLTKDTNRKAGCPFFDNYSLIEHLVFSSHRFDGTTGNNPFPVIMGLYKKSKEGTKNPETITFTTEEGYRFSLQDWSYIGAYCKKYPTKETFDNNIYFWAMRDVNALKRNKSFLDAPASGAVSVDPDKLAYYCYVDLFKRFANAPYWMGNFDIPLPKEGFAKKELDLFERVAKALNPSVFGEAEAPTGPELAEVQRILDDVCAPVS